MSEVSLEYLNQRVDGLTITSPTTTAISALNTSSSSISVLLGGTAVPLSSRPYMNGFTANGANTVFTAQSTGKYFIYYQINTTAALGMNSSVYINGSNNNNLKREPGLNIQSFSSAAIISLNAGDTIQLTLYGLIGTAVLQSGVGASMHAIKISN